MIVRDAERQGYPFIEATRAALTVCDEMLISDGYSRDRTWEGLLALRDAFPDRVTLFRDRWPGDQNRGSVLAEMTNRVRRRCSGEYCLSVQANEIIDEAAAPDLTALPSRHQGVEMFSLYYPVLLGTHLIWTAAWRRRLFKNIPDIVAIGDAYDVCNVLPRLSPTVRRSLPEPIRHYRAVCPANYVDKLRTIVPRTRLWAKELQLAEETLQLAERAHAHVDAFWEQIRLNLEVGLWRGVEPGTEMPIPRRCLGTTDRVPSVMRHLIGKWRYDLDDSLAELDSAASMP